jgi:hypothetical protein
MNRSTLPFSLAVASLTLTFFFPTDQTSAQTRIQNVEPTQMSEGARADAEVQKNKQMFLASRGRNDYLPISPLAPPLLNSFNAVTFNDDAATTGFFHIPPDTSGAAGPSHVVMTVNTTIEWYTKAGVRENRQSLASFFTSLAPLTGTFDPKVIYDQFSSRFLVVTLERTDTALGGAANTSRIFVAVSDDSNPNGTWFFFQINSMINIGGVNRWADFPGFAVDEEAVYITANMFSFGASPGSSVGVRLWIINKTPFYTGGMATFTLHDPIASAAGALNTTAQPTQIYGTAPAGLGTFLMQYSGINGGGNVFLGMIRIDNPLTAPAFTNFFIQWGTTASDDNVAMALPAASQSGSARLIQTNDRRVSQTPVWRNNNLYLAASTRPTTGANAGQATARWFRVNTTNLAAPALADTGAVGGEDIAAGTYTFFPTVTADSNGNMAIGFSASGPNIFAGSYYTTRLSSDAAGFTEPVRPLRAGLDFYVRTFVNNNTTNSRWGDYSGIWLDPADEATFWVFNQSALTRGTTGVGACPFACVEDGRWGTAFGSFSLLAPTEVEMASASATAYSNGVLIRWETGYEADNLGFHVYRETEGRRERLTQQFIAGSALMAGPGTRLTAGMSYRWRDPSPGRDSLYWLEEIDLAGNRRWHGPLRQEKADGLMADSDAKLLSSITASQSSGGRAIERVAEGERQTDALIVSAVSDLAARPAAKITVKREGWYRVSQAELTAAGIDPRTDPRFLQLFVEGRQQPIIVAGEKDGRFDPSDAVEFYGLGLDSPSTDARVYWLVSGSAPGLRARREQKQGGPTGQRSFPYTVERRDRTVYFASLRNGDKENFFGAAVTADPTDQTLILRHLDLAGSARLEVSLQGVSQVAHRVGVRLNGIDVGEVSFIGQAEGAAAINLPPSILREGENTVTLTAQAGELDVSLVDRIRLTYQRAYIADQDALRLTAAGKYRLTIDGFTGSRIRVFDVTSAEAPSEVTGEIRRSKSGYSITLTVPEVGQRTLLAMTEDRISRPASVSFNHPSTWRQEGRSADLVIITRREFMPALAGLAQLRESQGLRVATIDVEDLFDEFSYGHKSPQAMKDFLTYAATHWQRAPRFALLVGDASFDPRGYLGYPDSDVVPTRLIDTRFLETASDDWFGDRDDDGLAEIVVGRLPAQSVQEAGLMARKIILYEQSGADAVLLFADDNDSFNFEEAVERLRSLVPSGAGVEEILRGQTDPQTARARLIEAINRGQSVVNYTGHGSVTTWRGSVLTSADARSLTNQQMPMFVIMTCLNGYFHDPAAEGLAEALMKSQGGAAMVWASSGLTGPGAQSSMNEELYRQMFDSAQTVTVGEAISRAKLTVANSDIRRTWILLGDPSARP